MSPVTIELVIILLLTIINGLFAMSEVALLSARKVRLQHLAERGNSQAAAALLLLKDPNNFLSTVQIGVTLVGVLSGAFGGATIAENIAGYLSRYPSVAQYGQTIGVSIVVLAITFLSLILGELVPKRLALHSPERLATAVARPMSFISKIGAPVVAVLSACTNVVLSILGIKDAGEPTVTEDDVRGLLRQGTQIGVFEPMEQQIVERVLQFGDRRVSMIMTPRIGEWFVEWKSPTGSDDKTLGLVDFSIFPHLDLPELPYNTMAHAEKWAATLPNPAYAIDDQTAIKVVNGKAEVISEGHWKLFPH